MPKATVLLDCAVTSGAASPTFGHAMRIFPRKQSIPKEMNNDNDLKFA